MRRVTLLVLALLLVIPAMTLARNPQVVQITGVITAIDAENSQIVVGDVVVQVTPTTTIVMKGVPVDVDTLAVGMTVKVCGKYVDGVLVAHQVSIRYLGK